MSVTHWFWLDVNCYSTSNTSFYQTMKAHKLNVKRFTDFDALHEEYHNMMNHARPN
jgi:hypothetical protein